MTGYEDYRHAPVRGKYLDTTEDADSYVRFAKGEVPKHEYTYPYVDSSDFGFGEDPKGSVIKTQPPRAKSRRRKENGERSRCVYCRDMFNHEENRRGHCQDAPDAVRTCIPGPLWSACHHCGVVQVLWWEAQSRCVTRFS